jgi:pimeloyl-ACP methyl ester carboxylesterase
MELRETIVEGRPVRYRVSGEGEPLVLVHGLAGSWRWWSPLFGALTERHRVHVLDLPRPRHTSGLVEMSMWLSRWLDAAGLERVDVVGHSLGGLLAAELAARRPARVGRLALVAPAGIPCGRNVAGRALPIFEALYDVRSSLHVVAADAMRAGPLDLARGVAFVWRTDLRSELALVRAPTLVIWGEGDRLVPARLAEEWHRSLPRARIVRLRCGHVPMLEAPGELAVSLLAFLDEELADDAGDEVGPRVVNGVRLGRDDDEPAPG